MAVFAAALTLSGCVTGTVKGAAVQTATTRDLETTTVRANNHDLNFIEQMRPLLRDTVTLGEQLLGSPGIDPAVRELAQASMNREQDEIVRLNALLEQWKKIDEGNGEASTILPETGSRGVSPSEDLTEATGTERARLYLSILRGRLELMITLSERQLEMGQSETLKDQVDVMVTLKHDRIDRIDELLASLS